MPLNSGVRPLSAVFRILLYIYWAAWSAALLVGSITLIFEDHELIAVFVAALLLPLPWALLVAIRHRHIYFPRFWKFAVFSTVFAGTIFLIELVSIAFSVPSELLAAPSSASFRNELSSGNLVLDFLFYLPGLVAIVKYERSYSSVGNDQTSRADGHPAA